MPTPAILLFIKAPRPGEVKTRLSPFLSSEAAAQVASCLAQDAICAARRCLPPGGRLVIAYAPNSGAADLNAILQSAGPDPDGATLMIGQRGGPLGERMENAVYDAAFDHDCGPFVLLGADCPLMPGSAIRTAFRLLASDEREGDRSVDLVLGPTEDGGYYLLGLRHADHITPLLEGVAWSTEQVFAQTAANAERLRLWVNADLPLCYDIDTPADLIRLQNEIEREPERRDQSPAITDWLRRFPLPKPVA